MSRSPKWCISITHVPTLGQTLSCIVKRNSEIDNDGCSTIEAFTLKNSVKEIISF